MDPMVTQLETFLRTMRRTGSVLLQHDMWEHFASRHASDEENAAHAREFAKSKDLYKEASAGLKKLVEELRSTSPESVRAWALAHYQILEDLIADYEGVENRGTEAFVGREEQEKWMLVHDGKAEYVDENTFYISVNPERYKLAFGIDP